jgi:hypothetical protein
VPRLDEDALWRDRPAAPNAGLFSWRTASLFGLLYIGALALFVSAFTAE